MRLNIEEIKQISYTGIRRAYAFMGLAINATNIESFNDYNLSKITKYIFLPTDLPIEEVKKIKIEFKDWIISNGFQEFLGSFEVFLDNIHFVYLNILTSKHEITQSDATKKHKSFKMKGVKKKLIALEKISNSKSKFFDHIETINIARNCLVHRRGLIEKKDLNFDKHFNLTWLGMDSYIEKFDKTRVYIFPPDKCSEEDKHAEKNELIKIEWNQRSKKFSIGDSIKLNTTEISEILMMMSHATNEIVSQLFEYSKKNNVKIEKV